MRPRTKISRITQAQESMAMALDQETVHTSIHDADYTARVVPVI